MRRLVIIAMVMLAPMSLIGQELVSTFSVDTSQYESPQNFFTNFQLCIGPTQPYSNIIGDANMQSSYIGKPTTSLFAMHKKNSNQYDIFSLTGKIGSIIIPPQALDSILNNYVYLSQTFINNDAEWEYIINFDPGRQDKECYFKLYDSSVQNRFIVT